MSARPFFRWIGGKGKLLDQILPHVPSFSGRYFEPFVGGGALFWALAPRQATLNDTNPDLIATYVAVRDEVEAVIEALRPLRYERAVYLNVQERFNATRPDRRQGLLFAPPPVSAAVRAAWFIFLLKTGFNGLHRVNGEGDRNVAFGDHDDPTICDEANLRTCSAALQGVELICADFAAVADRARPGDLVYLDSPYVPVSDTADFTAYTAEGFGPRDFARLRATWEALVARGVHVIASNSDCYDARSLYPGATFHGVYRSGSVSCDPTKRGRVAEILAVRLAGGAA